MKFTLFIFFNAPYCFPSSSSKIWNTGPRGRRENRPLDSASEMPYPVVDKAKDAVKANERLQKSQLRSYRTLAKGLNALQYFPLITEITITKIAKIEKHAEPIKAPITYGEYKRMQALGRPDESTHLNDYWEHNVDNLNELESNLQRHTDYNANSNERFKKKDLRKTSKPSSDGWNDEPCSSAANNPIVENKTFGASKAIDDEIWD